VDRAQRGHPNRAWEVDVQLPKPVEPQVLDTSPLIDPGSLAIGSKQIFWLKDAVAQSAALPKP
jgi:hypothetical protein